MTQKTLSIAFQSDKPLSAYGPLAQTAESSEFDVVSVYNDLFFQPAWPALFEMARHTKTIRLGPAAVNPFLTHPITIAGNLALLDELSHGRAYLGLARGAWLRHLNLIPARPVTALKEAFTCIRHLLAQDSAPLPGKVFSLAGGESFRWSIHRPDIPFMLGTWGPKAIRACAHLVEEIKVGGTANPAAIANLTAQLPALPVPPKIVTGAVTVVDLDGDAARDLARREVALYLPVVARIDPTLDLDPDWLARLQTAVDQHNLDQAAALISDETLSKFAYAGTPAQVIKQTAAIFAAGASRVEFGTPHGLTPSSGLSLLGRRVLPVLKTIVH